MQSHVDPKSKNNKIVLPNSLVVSSLFESYFSIRKSNWNLEQDQPIQLITSANTANKIKTSIELLELFQNAKSFEDWINIVYVCAEQENNIKQENGGHWYDVITNLFKDKPLLMLTIHAANAYMLSQLTQNDEFHQLKANLINEVNALHNAIEEDIAYHTAQNIVDDKRKKKGVAENKLQALSMQENYHHSYFLDIILPRENKAKELNERSFDEYEQHVTAGLRKLTLCKMLLGYAASSQLQLTGTNKPAQITLPKADKSNSDSESSELGSSATPTRPQPKPSPLQVYSTFAGRDKQHEGKEPTVEAVRRYNLRRHH